MSLPLNSPTVLVVEDEGTIRDLIVLHLKREGYAVDEAATGEEAISKIRPGKYRLLILDWMLPGVNGLDIARSARRAGTDEAILMVTARTETVDIVAGLEAGADDYVTKPFDVGVLMARVRALMRRTEKPVNPPAASSGASNEILTMGNLKIDLGAHEVTCGGEAIQLTPSEFKLLTALAENRGRVLTRDKLIECVQGEGVNVVGRAIDTHVFGLRKKLGMCADTIETIRGVGYRVKLEL